VNYNYTLPSYSFAMSVIGDQDSCSGSVFFVSGYGFPFPVLQDSAGNYQPDNVSDVGTGSVELDDPNSEHRSSR